MFKLDYISSDEETDLQKNIKLYNKLLTRVRQKIEEYSLEPPTEDAINFDSLPKNEARMLMHKIIYITHFIKMFNANTGHDDELNYYRRELAYAINFDANVACIKNTLIPLAGELSRHYDEIETELLHNGKVLQLQTLDDIASCVEEFYNAQHTEEEIDRQQENAQPPTGFQRYADASPHSSESTTIARLDTAQKFGNVALGIGTLGASGYFTFFAKGSTMVKVVNSVVVGVGFASAVVIGAKSISYVAGSNMANSTADAQRRPM